MSTYSPAEPSPSLTSSGYMVPERNGVTSDDEEIDSLPSESTTESELGDLDSQYSDAEAEWRESIEQLELLLTMVLVPFVGKYLGRKCAYWGWNRFMEWKYPVESAFRGRPLAGQTSSVGARPCL